jgi:hypothetical protein
MLLQQASPQWTSSFGPGKCRVPTERTTMKWHTQMTAPVHLRLSCCFLQKTPCYWQWRLTDIVATANTLDNGLSPVCDVTEYYMFLFLAITNTNRKLHTRPPDRLLTNNGPVLLTFLQQHDKMRQIPTCPS